MHKRKNIRLNTRITGSTLVEVMIAMILFVLVAVSITGTVVHMRKQSENTMYQTLAQSVAEGIMDQIRQLGYANLADTSVAAASAPGDFPGGPYEQTASVYNYRAVSLKFIAVGSNSHVVVQDFNQYWATTTTALTEIGARDVSGTILGVLVNVDYKDNAGSVVINPRRYMKMKVSIMRTINTNSNAVEVVLNYQWMQPDRSGAQYFGTREIRMVVSKIPTY